MRLIDADELLTDNTWEWFDEWGNCTAAGKAIMDAPTIDAEPVVRCKDCTHRYQHDSGRYFCEMYYGMGDVSDENYCSFGERKEP